MTAVLNEGTQFVDTSGKPLTGGFVYFGTKDLDPVLNPISIFADRELSSSLANPQTLDSNGRSTNKVWLSGQYSLKVEDLNNVQVLQELDNGEATSTGTTTLGNVSGANNITADATSTIITYVDQEVYSLKIATLNTGAVTLNIDAVGAISVVKNNGLAIVAGDFEANQVIRLVYNSTSDTFIWIDQKLKTLPMYEGAAIASATTTEIWATDGQTVHLTGNTTVTSFGTSPNIGAWRRVVCDGAILLTNGANLILPGGQNILTESGDIFFIYADTTTQHRVVFFPVDGGNVLGDFSRGHLGGLQLAQDSDADHDILVAEGECKSADNDADISLSAITKQIDASWVAGDDAGGLSSSLTVANDTWYHVHAIVVGGLSDVGFDTSVTAANLVSDHSATAYRRIGSVLTDGSANIIVFGQIGDDFFWDAEQADVTVLTSSYATYVLSTPLGIKTIATVNVLDQGTGSDGFVDVRLTGTTGPYGNTQVGFGTADDKYSGSQMNIPTNTSSQVDARRSAVSAGSYMRTVGYKDARGRDD